MDSWLAVSDRISDSFLMHNDSLSDRDPDEQWIYLATTSMSAVSLKDFAEVSETILHANWGTSTFFTYCMSLSNLLLGNHGNNLFATYLRIYIVLLGFLARVKLRPGAHSRHWRTATALLKHRTFAVEIHKSVKQTTPCGRGYRCGQIKHVAFLCNTWLLKQNCTGRVEEMDSSDSCENIGDAYGSHTVEEFWGKPVWTCPTLPRFYLVPFSGVELSKDNREKKWEEQDDEDLSSETVLELRQASPSPQFLNCSMNCVFFFQACLGATAKDGERNIVEVTTENSEGDMCTHTILSLSVGGTEQVRAKFRNA